MKPYLEIPLFLVTATALVSALGERSWAWLACGLTSWTLLWILGTKRAAEFGNQLVAKLEAVRSKINLRRPIGPAAEFFGALAFAIVLIQWDIVRKIFIPESGATAHSLQQLKELLVIVEFLVPFMLVTTFLVSKISGITTWCITALRIVMLFDMMFLTLIGLTLAFFARTNDLIVYNCIGSAMLTYTVFGLWKIFLPPSVGQTTS